MPSAAGFPVRMLRDGLSVRFRWSRAVIFGLLHILALAAFLPWFFSWSGVIVFFVVAYFTGGLGVTLGYHRLLTHRSFATFKPIEYLVTLLACLAWQGGPIDWVGTHRLHHAESDQPADPHSPRDGFGWAHIFWMLYTHRPQEDPRLYTRDLQRDPWMRAFERIAFLPQFLLAGLLFAGGWWLAGGVLGGISWVLWGFCLRVVVMYHGTWFVNSAAHSWGYRNFNTPDDSRNNWWVALFSFGEGWHNNHHAQQRSAAHGMRWFEFDLTYLTIRVMRNFGLAWKVVTPQRPA